MTMPWYSPEQLAISLGVTLPLFFFYAYRIYSLWLDHGRALTDFNRLKYVNDLCAKQNINAKRELDTQFAIADVVGTLDRDLISRRRALRSDAHIIILIGFFGTLIGVLGSFTSLVTLGTEAIQPVDLVKGIIQGGLATALVSSVVAVCISGVVLTYLSITEKRVATARLNVLNACRIAINRVDYA